MPNTVLICRHNKNGTGYCEHLGGYCIEGPCSAEELIEYAPVRHGRWTIAEDDYYGLNIVKCSVCHEEWCFEERDDVFDLNYHYCPNCGALMDKEE